MAYEFCVNSNITFGKGALKRLPDMLRQVGASKVMIVYDAGVKAAGIAEKVVRLIEESGIPYVIFDGVIPNPTNEVVGEASEIAKKEEVDAFIAAGGGSSIDLAKAINVLMKNPGPIERYGGINQVKNPGFPLIAIPTTAGTSSEITNVSALIDTKKVIKYVIIDNKIMPSMVLADPELTLTVPPSVTAATGMNWRRQMEIKHDPIEDSAAYKAISDEIDEEARKRMEMRKLQFEKEESEREEPFGVEPSWIHIFWHA